MKQPDEVAGSRWILSHQGHRLLQLGIALFLFASLEDFAVSHLTAPNLGRSVHSCEINILARSIVMARNGFHHLHGDPGRCRLRNVTDAEHADHSLVLVDDG